MPRYHLKKILTKWEENRVIIPSEDDMALFNAMVNIIRDKVIQTLAETEVKLSSEVVFRQVGIQQQVAQRNALLNEQVVSLAQLFQKREIDYAIKKQLKYFKRNGK